jgi:hypothetical protein
LKDKDGLKVISFLIITLINKIMNHLLNLIRFFKSNILAVIVGIIMFTTYTYYTFSGDRICNCEKVEKERRTRLNRFYNSNNYNHK